jgi:hypothetical protein
VCSLGALNYLHVFKQASRLQSLRFTVTPKHEDGLFVRAAVGYLPVEKLQTFLPQAKWFLRSWREMKKTEPLHFRTDVILVVQDWHSSLHELPCVNETRISRNETAKCHIMTGYIPLETREHLLANYRFANSIDAIPFAASGALSLYDMILRTDLDTFLTPRFSYWKPDKFIVGRGAFCFEPFDTCQRLYDISVKLDLATHTFNDTAQNIGSTWYGPTERVVACSRLAIEVMKYMHTHEFNETEKSKAYGTKGWPAWHYGVLTLYAGQIAINSCADFEKRPDMLDYDAASTGNTTEHAHLHTWPGRGQFSKMEFANGKYDDIKLEDLNLEVIKEYATYMALDSRNITAATEGF